MRALVFLYNSSVASINKGQKMLLHNCRGSDGDLEFLAGLRFMHNMFFADDGFGNMVRINLQQSIVYLVN
jgi:hypothetical protein